MREHSPAESSCCSEENGNAICRIDGEGQSCACAESKPAQKPVLLLPARFSQRPPHELPEDQDDASSDHHSPATIIRSGLLFGVACLTSPCCAPLLVPFGLTLLAGTPMAVALTHHLGWIYTVLTLICVSSLALALLVLRQKPGQLSRRFKQEVQETPAAKMAMTGND